MKQFFVFASSLLVTAMAWAQFPIEGSWGMVQSQGALTFDMTITVRDNSVTLTNVCSLQGRSAQAQAKAPATYDQSSLTILAPAENHQSANGVNCDVSVSPSRMNYVVQGNNLILSQPGSPQQLVLTRRSN